MSVVLWKAIFDWAAVGLVGLTFIAGAGALIMGKIIDDRKSEQLRQFQTDLALKQKEAADAQLTLQRASAFAAAPRRIIMGSRNRDDVIRAAKFKELSKYAATPAIIVFVRDDEAETLANDIAAALKQASWKSVTVIGRESTHIPQGYIENGVQVHTFLRLNNVPVPGLPPLGTNPPPVWTALFELLNLDLGKDAAGTPFGVMWTPDGVINGTPMGIIRYGFQFPENGVVITVGRKPVEQIFTSLPEPAAAEPVK